LQISPNGRVLVIESGVLAARSNDGVCIGMYGRASVIGLERTFASHLKAASLEVVLAAEWLAVPIDVFRSRERPFWAERMFAHQAIDRTKWLVDELSCALAHNARGRLAKWLLRLHHLAGRPNRLPITQATLAALLHCQRTTVNAQMTVFERQGLLRTGRAYINQIDREGLAAESCGCA